MGKIDYRKISSIPRSEGGTLILYFSDVNALSTFEVAELFVSITSLSFDGDTYQVEGRNEVVNYLRNIHFFERLEEVKGLVANADLHAQKNSIEDVSSVHLYKKKDSFYTYANKDMIATALADSKIGEDEIDTIIALLGEVIDNAFSHNLGKWDPIIGPVVIFLMQHNQQEGKLHFSVCDFGIGFLGTLKHNYPDLKTEGEAILRALSPEVTGRDPQRGGNGLNFLRENVFNGFKGELYIRSRNTLIAVKNESAETPSLETSSFKGSGVFFSLVY